MMEYIDISEIKDNMLSHLEKDSLNIIHLQIGSFMYQLNSGFSTPRNHEFPKIIELLHNEPFSLIDPFIMDDLEASRFEINQISYMIDGAYLNSKNINGYPHNIELVKNSGKAILNPVVVQNMISEEKVIELLQFIETLEYNILVNIMDFTSYVCKRLFVENQSNKVHITFPSCLANDSKSKYIPCITKANSTTISPLPLQLSLQLPLPLPSLHSKFRWINHRDDNILLKETSLLTISFLDINYFYNMINFLRENRIEFILYNRLLGLYKLWVLMGYSNDNKLTDGTIINFSKITYNQFYNLWKTNPEFEEMVVSKIDNYFKENIRAFLNNFTDKYCEMNYEGNNNDFIRLMRTESYNILGMIGECKSKQYMKKMNDILSGTVMKYTLGDILREEGVEM